MSDLAKRARDYALIAGDFGATIARECADALDDWENSQRQTVSEACKDDSDARHCACVVFLRRELAAKDTEIARLQQLAVAEESSVTHLGTSAADWYGMWGIANERANKAESDLAALRAAVLGLPILELAHKYWCDGQIECTCGSCDADCEPARPCDCGLDAANAALAAARKAAGLG